MAVTQPKDIEDILLGVQSAPKTAHDQVYNWVSAHCTCRNSITPLDKAIVVKRLFDIASVRDVKLNGGQVDFTLAVIGESDIDDNFTKNSNIVDELKDEVVYDRFIDSSLFTSVNGSSFASSTFSPTGRKGQLVLLADVDTMLNGEKNIATACYSIVGRLEEDSSGSSLKVKAFFRHGLPQLGTQPIIEVPFYAPESCVLLEDGNRGFFENYLLGIFAIFDGIEISVGTEKGVVLQPGKALKPDSLGQIEGVYVNLSTGKMVLIPIDFSGITIHGIATVLQALGSNDAIVGFSVDAAKAAVDLARAKPDIDSVSSYPSLHARVSGIYNDALSRLDPISTPSSSTSTTSTTTPSSVPAPATSTPSSVPAPGLPPPLPPSTPTPNPATLSPPASSTTTATGTATTNVSALNIRISELTKEVADLQAVNSQLTLEKNNAETLQQKYKQDLTAVEKARDTFKRERDAANSTISTLQSEIKTKDTSISRLTNDLNTANSDKATLAGERDTAVNEVVRLQREVTRLTNQYTALASSTSASTTLTQQLADAQKAIADAGTNLSNVRGELATKQSELDAEKRKVARLDNEILALKSRLAAPPVPAPSPAPAPVPHVVSTPRTNSKNEIPSELFPRITPHIQRSLSASDERGQLKLVFEMWEYQSKYPRSVIQLEHVNLASDNRICVGIQGGGLVSNVPNRGMVDTRVEVTALAKLPPIVRLFLDISGNTATGMKTDKSYLMYNFKTHPLKNTEGPWAFQIPLNNHDPAATGTSVIDTTKKGFVVYYIEARKGGEHALTGIAVNYS